MSFYIQTERRCDRCRSVRLCWKTKTERNGETVGKKETQLVSYLVLYAQSTTTVISRQEKQRVNRQMTKGRQTTDFQKWFLKNWTQLTNTHPVSLPLHIPKQPHPELQESKSKTDHRQEHLALLSPAGLSLCKLFLMANDLPTTHTQDVGL